MVSIGSILLTEPSHLLANFIQVYHGIHVYSNVQELVLKDIS